MRDSSKIRGLFGIMAIALFLLAVTTAAAPPPIQPKLRFPLSPPDPTSIYVPLKPAFQWIVEYYSTPTTYVLSTSTTFVMEISRSAGFPAIDIVYDSPDVPIVNPITTYQLPSALLPNTTYYWRVKGDSNQSFQDNYQPAYNPWTAPQSFTTAVDSPVLQVPSNGLSKVQIPVDFQWLTVSGAKIYELQVSENSLFSPIVFQENDITDPKSDWIVDFGPIKPNKKYYWRMRAGDGQGHWGNWSQAWVFDTNTLPSMTGGIRPDLQVKNWSDTTWQGEDSYSLVGYDQQREQTTARGQRAIYNLRIHNTGAYETSFNVIGSRSSDGWTVQYFYTDANKNNINITQLVTTSGWHTIIIGAGGYQEFWMEVYNPNAAQAKMLVIASSATDSTQRDVVMVNTTSIQQGIKPDLNQPTLTLPDPSGATNVANPVQFSWNPVPGATKYRLELAKDALLVNVVTTDNVTAAADTISLDPGATYYWTVWAGNDFGWGTPSAIGSFTTMPLLIPPVLLALGDGALGNISPTPLLRWQPVPTATSYNLQVTTGADTTFATPIINWQNIPVTRITADLNANTSYIWRVSASNGVTTSSWSQPWAFRTTTAIAAPAPYFPNNYETDIVPENVVLTWSVITSVTVFTIELAKDAGFTTGLIVQNNILGSQSPKLTLEPNTTYYWHIRAANAAGVSGWSATSQFTTIKAQPVYDLDIQTRIPGVPDAFLPGVDAFQITYTCIPAIYYLTITNIGDTAETYNIIGGSGANGWVVEYFNPQGSSVTLPVTLVRTKPGWTTPKLAPNGTYTIRMEVTPTSGVPYNDVKNVSVTITCTDDNSKTATLGTGTIKVKR